MSETLTIDLHNRQQARAALTAQVFPFLAAVLQADKKYTMTIKPRTRSGAENRMLHAMLGYISTSIEWAGKKRDVETWKRLLIAAWCRATNEHVEILPALDGHGIDIVFKRSSSLSVKECAELIEFVYAWGAMNGVQFPAWDHQND